MPSRLSTARPPSRPISMASLGLTTPSMAAAMMGIWKRWPQSSHEMSTSLGLMVSDPGTSAMSSKPYAARALRPRPTHMPIRLIVLSRPGWVAAPPGLAHGELPYIETYRLRPTVFRGVYERARGVSTPAAVSRPLRGIRALPQHAQALEREIGIHHVDALRHPAHLLGESARRHDLDGRPHLASHALHEPVDEARPAVGEPRLDIGRRVAAYGLLWLEQLDPEEAGGTRDQCLGGGDQSRRDGAPDELSPTVDAIEGGGRAEIHHDQRGAVEGDAAHDGAEAIGSHFLRRVHEERHIAHARLDGERVAAEIRLDHDLERLLHGGHHVGDGHATDLLLGDASRGQDGADEHPVLVGRLLPARGQAPGHEEPGVLAHADLRVGVANLNEQEHGQPPWPLRPRRREPSRRRPSGSRGRRRGPDPQPAPRVRHHCGPGDLCSMRARSRWPGARSGLPRRSACSVPGARPAGRPGPPPPRTGARWQAGAKLPSAPAHRETRAG